MHDGCCHCGAVRFMQNDQGSSGRKHVREMDFKGKPMQGFVYVPNTASSPANHLAVP